MKRNKADEALDILNRMQIEQRASISYLFHITLGDVYAQLGRNADAVAEYNETLRLRPDLSNVAEMIKARMDQLK